MGVSDELIRLKIQAAGRSGTGPLRSSSFDSTENPISEGGVWQLGDTDGVDWGDVKTTGGQAVGANAPTPTRYSDPIAHMKQSYFDFANNQFCQATVYLAGGYTGNGGSHEIELLLRWEITANNARGYEVLWGIQGANAYLAIVRWNGANGDFTPLYDGGFGSIAYPTGGDVLKATIVGTTISVYRNGAFLTSVTDTTWTEGQPGMGFWPVDGAIPENYGWADFTAGDL